MLVDLVGIRVNWRVVLRNKGYGRGRLGGRSVWCLGGCRLSGSVGRRWVFREGSFVFRKVIVFFFIFGFYDLEKENRKCLIR